MTQYLTDESLAGSEYLRSEETYRSNTEAHDERPDPRDQPIGHDCKPVESLDEQDRECHSEESQGCKEQKLRWIVERVRRDIEGQFVADERVRDDGTSHRRNGNCVEVSNRHIAQDHFHCEEHSRDRCIERCCNSSTGTRSNQSARFGFIQPGHLADE